MTKRLLSASAVLLAAAPLFAQGGPGGPMGHVPGPFGGAMHAPVTNAPYSATFTSTSSEKLQDGTVLNHTDTRTVARDSLGRTREETTLPARGSAEAPHTMIVILDPVARTVTQLRPEQKVAVVHTLPAADPAGAAGRRGPNRPDAAGTDAAAPRGPRERKHVTTADLGSKTIAGVVATGERMTRTIPAGDMGNTTPLVSTHEEWFSPDLKIEVARTDTDPFRGTHTTTVSGLTKAEPDAALFQVPPGYTTRQAPQRADRHGFGGPRRGGELPPPPPDSAPAPGL